MKRGATVLAFVLTLVLSVASPAVAKGAADSVAATWRLVEHANFANVTYYIKDQKIIIYGAYSFESASSVFGTVDVSRKVADEPCLVDVTRVESTRLTEDPSTCVEPLPGGGPISATYYFNGSGKFVKSIDNGATGSLPSTGDGEMLAALGWGALLIVVGLILRKLA